MAYMSQENKKKIAESLKVALKGSGLKYTLSVHNHSSLVMKIKSGPVDFIANYVNAVMQLPRYANNPGGFQRPDGYMDINPYWYHEHFTGDVLKLVKSIVEIMNVGNHDNSDIQSDHFDVGWYVNIHVGTWDNHYEVVK